MRLLARVRALLNSLDAPALAPWRAAWPAAPPDPPSVRAVAPHAGALPVLAWLPAAARTAPAFSAPVCAELLAVAARLAWHRTYTQADVSSGAIEALFLERYGWCELLRGRALACGFLLLGPGVHYPAHHHQPEELYLPLSGTAEWQQGDGVWRERPAGALIHHAALEPHAMRTGSDPLLALYLWRGSDLATHARLDR